MWKKLIAVTIALMIITSFTMTVFAGNPEGAIDASAPTAANAAKNSASVKDAAEDEEDRASKTEQKNPVTEDDQKSTYDEENLKGPDAEFYTAIKNVLDEGKAVNNEQSILSITKPGKINETLTIFSKKFNISVKTEFDDVVFSVARLNSETGKYERIEFDGEKSIILASRTDSKEVILDYGINNLLLISYRNSEKVESKVQYNTIIVDSKKESADDKAVTSEKTYKKPNSDPMKIIDKNLKTFFSNLKGKIK